MEEPQGAVEGKPTEEEMLEILSKKYEFHLKGTPYTAKQVGTKPKMLPFISSPIQSPFYPSGNQPSSSGHKKFLKGNGPKTCCFFG
ncbi:hypothetical protein DPMN_063337 [Dreissena polymorpha]|uniref:Uncharacterized protein n=1 Tax=Dreissena polymorpha TaxID=45954 RepID=A0A9D4HK50_DREPO|nr:hypothetical protein DPMN_063337 [Dreissena polymorpha]